MADADLPQRGAVVGLDDAKGSQAFGRIGQLSEVADTVAFPVSDRASFITGSELVIDGGQCLKIQ